MDVGQELPYPTLASTTSPTGISSAPPMSNGSSVDQSDHVYSSAEGEMASIAPALLHSFDASTHRSDSNNVSDAALSSHHQGLLPASGGFDLAAFPEVSGSLATTDAFLEDGFFQDSHAYDDDTMLNAGFSSQDQSWFSSFNNFQWVEGFDTSPDTFAPDHFTGMTAPPISNDAPHASDSPEPPAPVVGTDSCIDPALRHSYSGPGQSPHAFTGTIAAPNPYDALHASGSLLSSSTGLPAPPIHTDTPYDPAHFYSHSASGQATSPNPHTREGALAFLQQSLEARPDIRQPDTIFFIVSTDLADHGPHALSYRDRLARKTSGTMLEQYSTLNKEFPLGSHLFLANSCGCCTAVGGKCDGSFPCQPCQSHRIICLPTAKLTTSMTSATHNAAAIASCTTQARPDVNVAPSRRRKRKLPACDGEDEAENQSAALPDDTEADTKKGVVTRPIKRWRKDGQPSCTDGYRNSIPQAPPLLTRLPGIPCTDEELLTYHPNHVKWPHLAARLIINGWTPPEIARFINEARGLKGTLDEMKTNTYTKMISNSGLVTYESGNGKKAEGKWALKKDVSVPDPSNPSAYEPRQKDQENKITDYVLADLVKGVAVHPSGEKAGVYSQCIAYAVSHPEANWRISDVGRLVETLQVPVTRYVVSRA